MDVLYSLSALFVGGQWAYIGKTQRVVRVHYIIRVTWTERGTHVHRHATATPPDIRTVATILGAYCCIMSTPSSNTPQPTPTQPTQSAAATPQFVAYPLAPGQQPQLAPQASSSNEGRTQPQTRLPTAETRKDRSLVDFLLMLDDYEPLVCVFI
jgi:hypothetical protein